MKNKISTIIMGLFSVLALIRFNSPELTYQKIEGSSMEPNFHNGELVKIQEVKSPKDINIGDVIVFETNLGLFFHRIIEINQDEEGIYYTIKGDSKPLPDLGDIKDNKAEIYKLRFNQIKGKYIE